MNEIVPGGDPAAAFFDSEPRRRGTNVGSALSFGHESATASDDQVSKYDATAS